jgi:hypothetical protein
MNAEMIDHRCLFIYRPDRTLSHVMNDSFRSWRQFPSHLDILRLSLHFMLYSVNTKCASEAD